MDENNKEQLNISLDLEAINFQVTRLSLEGSKLKLSLTADIDPTFISSQIASQLTDITPKASEAKAPIDQLRQIPEKENLTEEKERLDKLAGKISQQEPLKNIMHLPPADTEEGYRYGEPSPDVEWAALLGWNSGPILNINDNPLPPFIDENNLQTRNPEQTAQEKTTPATIQTPQNAETVKELNDTNNQQPEKIIDKTKPATLEKDNSAEQSPALQTQENTEEGNDKHHEISKDNLLSQETRQEADEKAQDNENLKNESQQKAIKSFKQTKCTKPQKEEDTQNPAKAEKTAAEITELPQETATTESNNTELSVTPEKNIPQPQSAPEHFLKATTDKKPEADVDDTPPEISPEDNSPPVFNEKTTLTPLETNTSKKAKVRYICPKCKTPGIKDSHKVGSIVTCSNCGRAMRLTKKK